MSCRNHDISFLYHINLEYSIRNLQCLSHFACAYCFSLRAVKCCPFVSLRKHAYSNILKILQPKKENFQLKNSDIFQTSAQNIDCEYSFHLVELMMYLARRCFRKVETHQTTANNPEIPQTTLFIYRFTPNHLLYLFFTLNYFIYYLKWNVASKMFDSSV